MHVPAKLYHKVYYNLYTIILLLNKIILAMFYAVTDSGSRTEGDNRMHVEAAT